MSKSKSFNPELWSNMLQYENEQRLKMEPITAQSLKETFSLSQHQAGIYFTLLSFKDQIAGSIEADMAIRKMKKDLVDTKKREDVLKHQIEELYNALELTFITKVDPAKIKKIDPEIYKVIRSSSIGFFSVLSDAHVEETVRAASTFGHNEYNLDIAAQRLFSYFIELNKRAYEWSTQQLLEFGRQKPQLLLHLGGDFITGWIHPEGVETNSLSPAEAIIFAEHNILSGLEMLVQENNYEKITVVCTAGNHARITEKKRYATGYRNSFEHIMYKNIKRHIEQKYPNVDVLIAEGEFITVEFMGKLICCSHGDHFKYAGGIGGLLVPAIRWVHKMSQIVNADLFSIGHWHSYMALPDSKLLVNGSVIGPSAFSIGLAFKPEPAKMQLQYVDSELGFTTNDPIFLK